MKTLVAALVIASSVGLSLAATRTGTSGPTTTRHPATAKPAPPPPPLDADGGVLPELDQIGGMLNVGNIGVVDDGSVRDTLGGERPVVLELLSEPADLSRRTVLGRLSTAGYSAIGIYLRGDGAQDFHALLSWRWDDDESFGPASDFRDGVPRDACQSIDRDHRTLCSVRGSELQLVYDPPADGAPSTVTSVRVYLIP